MALLKVILKKYYNLEPQYETTEPNPYLRDLDAALIIGNEAMVPVNEPVSYSYDLGELWLRKTGFPVVFAVFAVQDNALDEYREKIDNVIQSYHRSLAFLDKERETVIAGAEKRYPNIPYDLDEYYSTLQFSFAPELRDALEFYFQIAGELGVLKAGTTVRYRE